MTSKPQIYVPLTQTDLLNQELRAFACTFRNSRVEVTLNVVLARPVAFASDLQETLRLELHQLADEIAGAAEQSTDILLRNPPPI